MSRTPPTGLTLCAECGLISDLVANGGGSLVALSIKTGAGAYLAPCGRCRQLLVEHGSVGLLVDQGEERPPRLLAVTFPDAFTSADIPTPVNGEAVALQDISTSST